MNSIYIKIYSCFIRLKIQGSNQMPIPTQQLHNGEKFDQSDVPIDHKQFHLNIEYIDKRWTFYEFVIFNVQEHIHIHAYTSTEICWAKANK